MKHPYTVTFVKTSETLRWQILDDAWNVRKDFRWPWMTRAATWIFSKLGVNAREPFVEVERLEINPREIMDKIFAQREAMIDMRREPSRVLMGSEDFAELMRQPEAHHHFQIDLEYHKGDRYGGRRVFGLKLEIVPWMRGVLVMP